MKHLTIPCEVAVRSVAPAIRAMIAKKLIEKHSMKQTSVAEILGISQSAVSKYTREVRGHAIAIDNIEETKDQIGEMVTLITNGGYHRTEFLKLFCEVCKTVRRKGLMCQFCVENGHGRETEECRYCQDQTNI